MMNTNSVQYLEAVGRFGSISQAAKHLYISQPYLSKFIKEVESELGVTLINRDSNPITLTYAGERYLDYMNQIKYTYKEMKQELQNISALKKGRLVIGVNPILAAHTLYDILPEFIKAYPGIELKLIEEPSHRIEQLLIDNKIDIALTILPFYQGTFKYDVLYSEAIYLALPPEYSSRLSHQSEDKNVEDIHDVIKSDRFILLKPNMALRHLTNQILENDGITPHIVMETMSVDNALRLVNEGLGMTYVPESVKNSMPQFKEQFIKLDTSKYANHVVLAYKYDKLNHLSKSANAFLEMAKSIYRD
ncbi:LysR family transcriptional regulator [Staphylococcus warneri]|uniref:LysR family transcriptional regulator n=1 Tax=Staphylococcus TaxID=1279 RepID=UPI0006403F90|nr:MULTISPECIES: LysR family transcriptional regulator [Staphylococcus]KTW20109.1 transcriptional regulator [Staphylococcus warneri]MCM3483031.1 LysR family transcriptional regulator [Staphylococcus warneri]MCT1632940.1 LysR family transcriptional regulator [Staphylococcus warneri]MCT2348979.1 LysR family transcriptional regulator [Staphylococcus warneri]MCV7475621.1 LysR family transcriptional regulator [Staphylococcus warneri]